MSRSGGCPGMHCATGVVANGVGANGSEKIGFVWQIPLRLTLQNRLLILNVLSSTLQALRSDRLPIWLLLAALVLPAPTQAVRLVDLVDIEGVRKNQLIGYGLVVGLQGTGDQTRQTIFTSQSMINMLRQFGIQLPQGSDPRMKNVAAVSVSANLPTFARAGTTLDVVVSSIGDAKSLRGGVLLASPLRGIDGQVYAPGPGFSDCRRHFCPGCHRDTG
ncbi:flagellar basal body P-ring protein FlgI [Endozoicomonas sp. SCSIO W0465]|uniref:flagellar basal body P-ring protein FlgI n=1 Tax=Endozoicomonas sp. SCSIO W0465 TaxID=2918516 RepID=UPI002075ACD4|nr:flagellar basal body P-ring protein FlgI [Endozoicomonas sp. SCSIO W0465]